MTERSVERLPAVSVVPPTADPEELRRQVPATGIPASRIPPQSASAYFDRASLERLYLALRKAGMYDLGTQIGDRLPPSGPIPVGEAIESAEEANAVDDALQAGNPRGALAIAERIADPGTRYDKLFLVVQELVKTDFQLTMTVIGSIPEWEYIRGEALRAVANYVVPRLPPRLFSSGKLLHSTET